MLIERMLQNILHYGPSRPQDEGEGPVNGVNGKSSRATAGVLAGVLGLEDHPIFRMGSPWGHFLFNFIH